MSAVLISADLMTTSAAQGAAQRAGVELKAVALRNAASAVSDATRLVVIDLTHALTDLTPLVGELRATAPSATIIAFGPHVQEQRLQAARAAGCDEVITRGQWHNGAEQLLRDHCG
ncbi:MAG: DNA-binding response regulator [Planctomycetota bacterium]